jgi:hypothetical protein
VAIIKFKRGTRSQLDSAAGGGSLQQGEPYLITDEGRVAVGLSSSTYSDFAKADEITGSGPMNSAYANGTGANSLGTTEAQLGSVTINVTNSSSKVLVIARVSLTKDTGATARTATIRVRRGTTNSDTQVGRDSVVVSPATASAAYYGVAVVVGEDAPGTTGNVTYSVRGLVGAGASTSAYELEAIELTGAKGEKGDTGATGGSAGDLAGVDDTVTGTSHTLADSNKGYDLRCTNASAIALNIDTEANSGISTAGWWCLFSQGGAGAVTATALSGVTLRAPNGAATTAQYDARGLEYLGSNEWRVW